MTLDRTGGPTDVFGRHLRDLRISVTDRCNFRCPYCMPAEIYGERYEFLPKPEILTFEEIARLARLFTQLGVRKIRLTGGEPLLRAELPRLIESLAVLDGIEEIALTTNGYMLADQARALKDAGLSRVTVSLDSLDEEVFKSMNGRNFGTRRVLAGIDAAGQAGLNPIKINAVVQKGVNDHTIVDLARHFKGTGHIVRFIEFMDVGTVNEWDAGAVVTARDIADAINAEFPITRAAPGYPGEVATRWTYDDGTGEIGIISSVSEPFCGDCTRARLSTDGQLVTCLFASGGKDLKGPLRAGASDDDMLKLMTGIWSSRRDRYSELRAFESGEAGRDSSAAGGDATDVLIKRRTTGAPIPPVSEGARNGQRRKIEMYQIGG
ncbi:MAG: GTP 3',8-cyclase MoaA [Chloroflexi bacterium]|nr:GTP 3',8-cyclase MoaA [Chloroflexota bacterium]